MLKLPKLDKGIKQPMTKLEKVAKVIVAAALTLSFSIAVPFSDAQAAAVSSSNALPIQGSMLLTPAFNASSIEADHYSHYSHSSHESHSSHYSHYSSRN